MSFINFICYKYIGKTNNKETKTKTIYLVYCIPYLIFTMQCYWHLLGSAMYESQILSFYNDKMLRLL